MSTKTIREALEAFREKAQGDEPALWEAAVAEVEAIEKACLLLYEQGIVINSLGEQHETTNALDAAADRLMAIGAERLVANRESKS